MSLPASVAPGCYAGCYAGCIHSTKLNVMVWRLPIPSAYSPWLTRRQHMMLLAYISARQ